MDKNKMTEVLRVRMTRAQLEQITKRASALGLTKSDYARFAMLQAMQQK